ncbi:cytochrome C [Actinomadura craniellae]|uniref:Cytochrome C n=1 Tax=Actinomadura craniellae TaxID=2231787 RepID=A0A365H159_9ACTN|nr:cytochrome C [Actinomadura craniellae]
MWGKIPPRNKNFTGREDLLAKLRKGIADQVTAVVPHALHGLGGVGKTQMAVEYAYRYRDDYDLVWWIPADQPVLVRSTLAGLAPHLGLPSPTASGIEDAMYAVLNALRRGDPYSKWLLIFDNADQPEELNEIIPQGSGHVLITSRNHRWDGVVDTVAVDVFSREESVQFLGKRVPRISGGDADRLAKELGDLPLALEQAGALQSETGIAVSEYLRLLEERTGQLLSEGKPTEYPVSMTAAWGISVTSLAEKLPEAVELLRYCAFFGPEPIPRDAFSQLRPGLDQRFADLLADPIRLTRAVAELGRYALARIDSAERTIQVHRLIQALVREELPEAKQRQIGSEVHLLLAGFAPSSPADPNQWPRYQSLLGHIEPSGVAGSRDPDVRELADNFVRYLHRSGDFPSARSFAEQFIEQWTKDTGEHDLNVLDLQRQLGNILRELGEYGAAAELDRQTLAKLESTYGSDHKSTLLTLNGIGADLRTHGEFLAARDHDENSLGRYEEIFGKSDLITLGMVNSLALDLALSSDYQGAKKLHESAYIAHLALAQGEPNFDKVSLLVAWSGLARAVRLCGDYAEACDLGEDAYAYGVSDLGADHPWTLRTAKDLSIAWRRTGEFDQSLDLAQDVHARYVRLFGLDHPDTLAAAMCLANIQRTTGRLDDALELAADTVQRYPRIYGPEHPYNHGCAGNLALLRRVFGDAREGRELNERALVGLEAKLGRDHHYTLTVATNLASDLAALGELENACRLGRGTLRRLEQLLGETHPMVLVCAANLSANLRDSGEEEEAETLFQRVQDGYARTLGLEHPDARVALERRYLDSDFDPPPN